jgi:hypothetical protein
VAVLRVCITATFWREITVPEMQHVFALGAGVAFFR